MATRNLAAEQDALKRILESPERDGAYTGTPGASIPAASPATQSLLQEAIRSDVYGSGVAPRDVSGRLAEMQKQTLARSSQAPGTIGTLTGAEGTTGTLTGATDTTLPSTEDIYSRYGLTETKTKEQLEQEAIDAIQGQLAGIESTYASKLATEAAAGAGRQAQGRALGFASGTQYSPFAQTRATEIEEYNRGVVSAIEADKQAEIANLYASARGEATESYENQQNRAMEMANTYIDQMTTNYQLGLQERQMLMNEARNIAEMTGTYGGSPTLEMLQWVEQTNQQAAENARSNEYLKIAQEDAASRGYETIEYGGTLYEYDPALGLDSARAIYTAPVSTRGGQVDRSDPLVRDTLYAYGRAGGDITNLSDQDIQNLVSYYSAGSGRQSIETPGEIFAGVGGTGDGVFQF